jgi:Trk K+ transport system NAD-binding subunit
VFLDLVVTTSARDEATLRNAGADNAFAVLARVMGDQSGLATVSIQIA